MSVTLKAVPVAAPVAQSKGFGDLPCPKCGEAGLIHLDLDTLETCSCNSCEEEFSLDTIRDIIANWAPVLAWIDAAPPR